MATAASIESPTPRPQRPDVVWIPGGSFAMGSESHYAEERPVRQVSVDGFWIDRAPVTNRAFAQFVHETGHRTVAEIAPDAADYPGALPENLVPASLVFTPSRIPVDLGGSTNQWWRMVPGADWQHPTGPGSNIRALADHPVVHVALGDVMAYAESAGTTLPTEAEWEFAARGGRDGHAYAWGNSFLVGGKHMANTWQGDFPVTNSLEDGWRRTSPIGSYPANGYGLVDMIGNVWEWTTDWWSVATPGEGVRPCCGAQGGRGGTEAGSLDPNDPAAIPRRVLKGGSHLCAPSYCQRYRPAARHAHPIDTSTSHIGFRCVIRP